MPLLHRAVFPLTLALILLSFTQSALGADVAGDASQTPDATPRGSVFTVTNLNDSGLGSLRQTIVDANNSPGDDTITFADGLTGTMTLNSDLPQITEALTIAGPGAEDITITGTIYTYVFWSYSGTFSLNISGLTIDGVYIGVITENKTLTLTDMVFRSTNSNAVFIEYGSLAMTRVLLAENGNTGSMSSVLSFEADVTITESVIRDAAGGGIRISDGSATIVGSTFDGNATSSGAGALYFDSEVAATLTIADSTFVGNQGQSAGAIVIYTVNSAAIDATITNSTFTANAATNGSGHDAIYANGDIALDIGFTTFSGHDNSSVSSTGGVLYATTGADIALTSSIIANNPLTGGGTPRECVAGSGGATITGSGNLTNDTNCPGRIGAPTNVSAALADNGGPTGTHALLAGSNAIDAYAGADCPATDQRGFSRPAADTDCDLGAFEFIAPPVCTPGVPYTIPAGDVAALIFAIECANDSPSNDVINLTDGPDSVDYPLTATHNSLGGDNGLPRIVNAAAAGTLTINGNGATISGSDERRVLYIHQGADVRLNSVTIHDGASNGFGGAGGGIYNSGTLVLTGSTVSGGSVATNGGGIFNNGTLTLTGSTVSGSTAVGAGGGIFNNADVMLTLTDSTIFGNTAGTSGGGIFNNGIVVLTDSSVTDNDAVNSPGAGGGIFSSSSATLTDSTVSGNEAVTGGGIYNTGTLELTDSSVTDNDAVNSPGGGGGIFSSSSATLTNSTVAGNEATSGGGIFNSSTMTLNNSTVAGNTSVTSGDGIHNSGALTLNNTIVANAGLDCVSLSGTIDASFTLFSNTSACGAADGVNGNIVGADARLGTPQTAPNGTTYYPLGFASPAIDAGKDQLVPGDLEFDQAGNIRFQGDAVDMGAFESGLPACPAFPATINAGDVDALILAIECANALPSNDIINLTDGDDYVLTATHNTMNGDNGLPMIPSAAAVGTLTINGDGATISGNDERRVLYLHAGAIVTLNNLTITAGNAVSGLGGGISSSDSTLTLTDVIISNSSADSGGGIHFTDGTLTLSDSTISDNSAIENGGGIHVSAGTAMATLTNTNVTRNTAGMYGGGIEIYAATVILNQSAVHGNSADTMGGGLYNYSGTLTLNNSTISENDSSQAGGVLTIGYATFNNSTISGNTATVAGGVANNHELTLNNSIVAGNTNNDCYSPFVPIESLHSLVGTQDGCGIADGENGNIVGADPLLGALTTAPNGTAYFPLLEGSPAINAGENNLVPDDLEFDQAGNIRIQDDIVDMGSFETDAPAAPDINITGFGETIANGDVTPSVNDNTDFGTTTVGTPVSRTFFVHNTGGSPLEFSLNTMIGGFSAFHPTNGGTVGVGTFDTFSVECLATEAGSFTATVSIDSNDPDEDPYTFTVACQVDAVIPPGITVTESGGSTAVMEAGDTDDIAFALESVPSSTVEITLTFGSGITVNGSASPVTLNFTGTTSQSVTVAAVNDSLVEGAHNVVITPSVASDDAGYDELELSGITVSVVDNDTASVAYETVSGSAPEGTAVYSVNAMLNIVSDPPGGTLGASVVVGLTHAPGTAAYIEDYMLSITDVGFFSGAPHGASVGVSVGIVDDALDEPDETFSLGFGGVSGPGTAAGTHVVTIVDDDMAGVTVTQTNGVTQVDENGDTDTYTIALATTPTDPVALTITFDAQVTLNGSASPLELILSDAAPVTLTVEAVNDSLVEGPHSTSLTHAFDSSDPNYGGLPDQIVAVDITDNDTASLVFETVSGSAPEGTAAYTVNAVLSIVSDPPGGTLAGAVSVDFSHNSGTATLDDYAVIVANASFDAGDGSGATRPVAATIINDSLVEGTEAFILDFNTVTGPATGSGMHVVTIIDNDTASIAYATASGSAPEGDTPYAVNAVLSIVSNPPGGTLGASVSVQIADAPGTATNPADYSMITNSFSFPAGASNGASVGVSVGIVDDALDEPDEIFTLGFGSVSGPATAAGTHVVTIVDDDLPAEPSDFSLLTPADGAIIAGVPAVFTWQTSALAETYTLDLSRTSAPVAPSLLLLDTLTPAADADGLSCDVVSCALSLTVPQQALLTDGDYQWTVTAANLGGQTIAANAPFAFTLDADGNLLLNGSFEQAGGESGSAAHWKEKKTFPKDAPKCDKPGKIVAADGECAFRFVNSHYATRQTRAIGQKVKAPPVGAGQSFTLHGLVQAKDAAKGAKLTIDVKYPDGTKDKVGFRTAAGTYDYTPAALSLPITGPVKWVRVTVKVGGVHRKFLIDDLVLWYEDTLPDTRAAGSPLPLPAAPQGFRGLD